VKPAAAWLALAGLCAVLASCASERPRIEDYLPRAPLPQHAPAHAAEPPARPLTLDAAVRIALDNNPLLRAAREGVAAAREAVGEARAPYFPRISGIGGFGRLEAHDLVVTGTRGIDIGPDNSYTFLGILTWDIYDFGYRHAQLKAAMARAAAAGEEAALTRHDIALNVSLAFHTLRAADENLDAAKRAAERAEDHVRLARERQAVGAAPEADVLRARVEAGNARLELVRAHSQVRLARGDLNTAMGLPVELPVDVAAPAEEILAPDQVDLTAAFDRALYNRPELRRQLARVDEARRSADAARASLYPRLTLDAFYLQQGQTFFPEGRACSTGHSSSIRCSRASPRGGASRAARPNCAKPRPRRRMPSCRCARRSGPRSNNCGRRGKRSRRPPCSWRTRTRACASPSSVTACRRAPSRNSSMRRPRSSGPRHRSSGRGPTIARQAPASCGPRASCRSNRNDPLFRDRGLIRARPP